MEVDSGPLKIDGIGLYAWSCDEGQGIFLLSSCLHHVIGSWFELCLLQKPLWDGVKFGST